ncbi:MAG: phosphate acyltransferase PlsX [Planctomycetota bacterium]|jgi:glycerol-3-phosphate acyltransferase PlsX
MRVAVDAMGGDHAPRALVGGCLQAARAEPELELLLVGRPEAVAREVDAQGGASNVRVIDAGDAVPMDEPPVEALKRRPDASILRALQLLGGGEADAVVSAGSTGATVAAALTTLKALPGVSRPGIAVPLPARNRRGVCLLLDAGANPDSRARHLQQYAFMGANYYRQAYAVEAPRVALISMGEEEHKGTRLTREVAGLLRASSLDFVGNVEARGLFGGACEVAVADGFVGNLILKTVEGLGELLLAKLGESSAQSIAKEIDYAEFGAAPLLGVAGCVMICHGRSRDRAIFNAIRAGMRAAGQRVHQGILDGLEAEEAHP